LPLRSEQHGNYLGLFVDTGHLHLLRNPDWQVVYGRRGTGKTFLLGVLQEEAARSLTESRIMSIFVTAQDCLVSPVGREVPDKIRALGYFQTFIELLTDRVAESVDRLTADTSFLDTLTGRRHHLLDRIVGLQYDLLVAAQQGAPVLAYSSFERKKSEQRTRTRARSATVGAEARLGTKERAAAWPVGSAAAATAVRPPALTTRFVTMNARSQSYSTSANSTARRIGCQFRSARSRAGADLSGVSRSSDEVLPPVGVDRCGRGW
jgi:hypothetical protein